MLQSCVHAQTQRCRAAAGELQDTARFGKFTDRKLRFWPLLPKWEFASASLFALRFHRAVTRRFSKFLASNLDGPLVFPTPRIDARAACRPGRFDTPTICNAIELFYVRARAMSGS